MSASPRVDPKKIFIVRNHYTGALCRDCFVERVAAERAAATLNAGSDPYNVQYVVESLDLVKTTE